MLIVEPEKWTKITNEDLVTYSFRDCMVEAEMVFLVTVNSSKRTISLFEDKIGTRSGLVYLYQLQELARLGEIGLMTEDDKCIHKCMAGMPSEHRSKLLAISLSPAISTWSHSSQHWKLKIPLSPMQRSRPTLLVLGAKQVVIKEQGPRLWW